MEIEWIIAAVAGGVGVVSGLWYILARKSPNPSVKKKPSPPEAQPAPVSEVKQPTWREQVFLGLAKTRDAFHQSVGALFSREKQIDEQTLEKIHEALYRADLGVDITDRLVGVVRRSLGQKSTWEEVSDAMKDDLQQIFSDLPSNAALEGKPHVILVVGVNGVGKTTSIAKLTQKFSEEGKKVLLCAADTFRAAAIDQLSLWADRLKVEIVKHREGADPAAVAFDGAKAAKARAADILLVDTAGRLHNKNELMQELGKISRSLSKEIPGAPHDVWLVVDATTGQNASFQVKSFKEVVSLTGLICTKLDGTAKGGILASLAASYQIPVRYIGVGEKAQDLREFDAKDFVDALF